MKALLLVLLGALIGSALCVDEKEKRQVATMTDFGFRTSMSASGGLFRDKRQFYGNQNAHNIQNNQFGGNHGHYHGGWGGRWKRQFFGNQQAQNIQNNQFGGNHAHHHGYGGRWKRQFYGNQQAHNIQNNQFGGNHAHHHGYGGRW